MLRGAHTPPLFLLSSPLSPVYFTTFISLYTPFSFFMAVGESHSFILKQDRLMNSLHTCYILCFFPFSTLDRAVESMEKVAQIESLTCSENHWVHSISIFFSLALRKSYFFQSSTDLKKASSLQTFHNFCFWIIHLLVCSPSQAQQHLVNLPRANSKDRNSRGNGVSFNEAYFDKTHTFFGLFS